MGTASHTPSSLRDVLVRTFGLSPKDASFWDEATDYDERDPEFEATDAERLQDIRPWLERFSPGTAQDWFISGMEVDEAMEYSRAGFTAQQAKEFVNLTLWAYLQGPAGHHTPLDFQDRWLGSGLEPETILARLRRGEVAP